MHSATDVCSFTCEMCAVVFCFYLHFSFQTTNRNLFGEFIENVCKGNIMAKTFEWSFKCDILITKFFFLISK